MQHLSALALAQSTVKRLGPNIGLAQFVGHDFGGVLGGDKHQHARPLVILNQVTQQLGAAAGIYFNRALRNFWDSLRGGRHLDPGRVAQQGIGQRLD